MIDYHSNVFEPLNLSCLLAYLPPPPSPHLQSRCWSYREADFVIVYCCCFYCVRTAALHVLWGRAVQVEGRASASLGQCASGGGAVRIRWLAPPNGATQMSLSKTRRAAKFGGNGP